MKNQNKITEGNAFALNIRQAVWRTLGGVIQPLLASELVDVHLYVGSGTSKSTATEYNVTADGDTISAVMPATLKRGVYRTWMTALYQGREVASACECAFEIVAFDEHGIYAPERIDGQPCVYLQGAYMTDDDLERLKSEYNAKIAALDAAIEEAEQARQEYIKKSEAIESVATSEQLEAIGMLTSEEIGRIKEIIGTPEEGQADTLFAAVKGSPIGIMADVEQGKQDISDAIVFRGGESSHTDTFSSMAESIRNLPLDGITIQGTWTYGIYPKSDIDVILNFKKQLTKIVNDTVRYIYNGNFEAVETLQYVKFENLTNINVVNCFMNCKQLTTVDMPLLEYSEGDVFNGCTVLEKINFPRLKKVKGSGFLANCKSLKNANLPILETLSTSFFEGSSSLVNVIANNVSAIERKAFLGCISLVRVETSALNFNDPIGTESTKINYFSVGRDIMVDINLVSLGSSNDWNTNVNADEWNTNFREGVIDRIADLSDLTTPKTITLGQYAFAKLTEDIIALALAKGWNVAQG